MKANSTLWFLLWLVISSCEGDIRTHQPVIRLDHDWELSEPKDVGLTDASAILAKAENVTRLTSLMVVRNGKLVIEEYYRGHFADSLHDVRSVTKSVMALLIGIAIEKGHLVSLDMPLEEMIDANAVQLSDMQKKITIRNLLTMSSGILWNEISSNSYSLWIRSGDPIGYVLDQPFESEPGEFFRYNSGAVHLLGVAFEHATGSSLPQYADQHLFGKMGIRQSRWESLPEGQVNGGAGIELRSRDLCRIGQLLLQSGNAGSEQIVSADWVSEMTKPRYEWRSDFGVLRNFTYGYLWWIIDHDSPIVLAWGHGGQFVFIHRELDLVIVTTTNWINSADAGGADVIEQAVLSLIFETILPRVQ